MTVVVTGASGFLGQHVVRQLERPDVRVVAVSRRSLPGVVRVKDYVDTPLGDVLIHLAQEGDRERFRAAGAVAEQSLTETMSALARRRYHRLVYTSSATLYGDAETRPRRTDEPVLEADAYARVKRAGEREALETGHGVVARLSNVFGPGMNPTNVVSTILGQIPGTGPLSVRDASPVRDFVWVEDAACALAAMALGSAEGIFNVGTERGTSIGDLARLALARAGQGDRAVVSVNHALGPSHIVVDIAETTAVFGWSPDTTLVEGLDRLLAAKGCQA